jgi:hypothetical protein
MMFTGALRLKKRGHGVIDAAHRPSYSATDKSAIHTPIVTPFRARDGHMTKRTGKAKKETGPKTGKAWAHEGSAGHRARL